jgi:hypothetical protein
MNWVKIVITFILNFIIIFCSLQVFKMHIYKDSGMYLCLESNQQCTLVALPLGEPTCWEENQYAYPEI